MNDSYVCTACGGFIEKGHSHECKRPPGVSFPIDIKHPLVIAFAKAMDEVLCQNDHKGGWKDCRWSYLQARLVEEIGEYFAIVANEYSDSSKAKKELLDIANFAMMLWDKY